MLCQSGQHRFPVMLTDIGRNATQKGITGGVLGHAADVAADKLHGVATVAAQQTVAVFRLRGAAVYNGNEVSGDDDAVLAFLRGVLGDEVLLDDVHRDIVR